MVQPLHQRASALDWETLLERVLMTRPDAASGDVRRLVSRLRDVPDSELADHMARIRQRIAAKAKRHGRRSVQRDKARKST